MLNWPIRLCDVLEDNNLDTISSDPNIFKGARNIDDEIDYFSQQICWLLHIDNHKLIDEIKLHTYNKCFEILLQSRNTITTYQLLACLILSIKSRWLICKFKAPELSWFNIEHILDADIISKNRERIIRQKWIIITPTDYKQRISKLDICMKAFLDLTETYRMLLWQLEIVFQKLWGDKIPEIDDMKSYLSKVNRWEKKYREIISWDLENGTEALFLENYSVLKRYIIWESKKFNHFSKVISGKIIFFILRKYILNESEEGQVLNLLSYRKWVEQLWDLLFFTRTIYQKNRGSY